MLRMCTFCANLKQPPVNLKPEHMNEFQSFITHFETYPNNFVEIEVHDQEKDITHQMIYKVTRTPDQLKPDSSIDVYNYITEQEESVLLDSIVSISWHGLDQPDEHHLSIIKKHREYDGWNREGWGLFEEDQELTDRFKEKYFLSHGGAKITAEQAYMLAKMNVKDLDGFYSLSVDVLKQKWLDMIISFKEKAVDMLNKEMIECEQQDLVDDIEEIKVILEMLSEIDQEADQELQKCDSIHTIMAYWPPLLLPAPVFSHLAYE